MSTGAAMCVSTWPPEPQGLDQLTWLPYMQSVNQSTWMPELQSRQVDLEREPHLDESGC